MGEIPLRLYTGHSERKIDERSGRSREIGDRGMLGKGRAGYRRKIYELQPSISSDLWLHKGIDYTPSPNAPQRAQTRGNFQGAAGWE